MIKNIGSVLQTVGLAALGIASFLLFGAVGLITFTGVVLFAVGIVIEIGKT